MMNNLKPAGSIVAEVDGSAGGLRAVEFACAEALRTGAELVLASPYAVATTTITIAPGSDVPAHLATIGLQAAVDTARRVGGSALPLTLVTGEGPRSKVLPAVARQARLLVLVGSEGRRARRLLAAQADLTLMARVGSPAVVVPTTWDPASGAHGVVAGVDGTELSTEALDFAFEVAANRQVPLTVVHAASLPQHTDDSEAAVHRAERILAEVLAGRTDRYDEVEVRRVATGGPATAALLTESRMAELLVVGAQTTALAAVNPVVRNLVADSACPVAVLPHRTSEADRDHVRRQVRPASDVVNPTY